MLADRLRAVVESGGRAAVADLYAADALLDANVPTWRFQRKGLDEIRAQYDEWYGEAQARVEEIREWAAEWGSIVEYEERGTHQGQQVYSRTLNLLFVEHGKVVKHIYYCTGLWDAETEARQKVRRRWSSRSRQGEAAAMRRTTPAGLNHAPERSGDEPSSRVGPRSVLEFPLQLPTE